MSKNGVARYRMAVSLLAIIVLILAACNGGAPAEEPAEPAAEEVAEEPTEEAAEEEPAEEEAADEEAADEEATEEPEEEAADEAEATEESEEEAADEAEATEEPEEEADAEAEATAAPEEEAEGEEAEGDEAMADMHPGEYVVTITGGCGCHMNRDLGGLAGGNEFEMGDSIAYASNITPDEETGIGTWTAEDIATALHTGATPDGEQLHPAMPYARFSALSQQEALAVGEYLLSLEPIANEVPERQLTEEPAAFTPASEPPAEPPTDPVARGEELVIIANCGGCHTPSDDEGNPNMEMMLAGAPLRGDVYASNITPDEETGIGAWSEEEIATFLQSGTYPSGDQLTEGPMAQQIDNRFHLLTDEDASAIAAYLMSIPAVSNDPSAQ